MGLHSAYHAIVAHMYYSSNGTIFQITASCVFLTLKKLVLTNVMHTQTRMMTSNMTPTLFSKCRDKTFLEIIFLRKSTDPQPAIWHVRLLTLEYFCVRILQSQLGLGAGLHLTE